MNISTFDSWSTGEKVLFGLASAGSVILLALSLTATLRTGPAPEYEQSAFTIIFLSTVGMTLGLLLGHAIRTRRQNESQQEEDAQ